ncbi:MAG TPA: class I SAM-dependent methyltransferase [Bacteroidota bacterium]|nr:class I SAM-dependent methyltransferase [Bacteroidota bacterium]
MDVHEQKNKVTTFFDESKEWRGTVYDADNSYFGRVIIRRKAYAFEMIRKIPDLKIGHALDVGFGSGVYIEELLKMGFECSGVDLSREMVDACEKRMKTELDAGRLHLGPGEVEHLPFKDNMFDLVICIGVLGYLLRDEKALAELKRVVKPGGYLLLNLTNMYPLSDLDYLLRRKIKGWFFPKSIPVPDVENPPYAMQSDYVLKARKFHFKSYNLWKYEKLVQDGKFVKVDSMTYGFEFRLLRKIGIPGSMVDRLELFCESLFRKIHIPYLSYSGWVYTAVFRRTN